MWLLKREKVLFMKVEKNRHGREMKLDLTSPTLI